MAPFDFSGKKILITHTLIADYMGSTVVCLQVAQALQEMDAQVVIVSSSYAYPMRTLFEESKLQVILERESSGLQLEDFDFVWLHSQLLPVHMIGQLREISESSNPDILPTFIFNHMASIDSAPDEHPYIPFFEEMLSSMSLYVSQEAEDSSTPLYDPSKNVSSKIFLNPAPSSLFFHKKDYRSVPEKIAIISNHVPSEMKEAKILLEEKNIKVDIIGIEGTPEDVSAPLLERYDVIVSIGKTVQYCLCSGLPVFIYDHFGGFGYLDNKNFDDAAYAHFSGRGGQNFPADELADKIVNEYVSACEYAEKNIAVFQDRFEIKKALQEVFSSIVKRKEIGCAPYSGYWKQIEHQMSFAWRYYRAWDYEIWQKKDRISLAETIEKTSSELSVIRSENARKDSRIENLESDREHLKENITELEEELSSTREALGNATCELDGVYSSWSFKIGFALIHPLRWAKTKLSMLNKRDR